MSASKTSFLAYCAEESKVMLSMNQTRAGPHQLCHSTTAITKRKLFQRKGKEESYLGTEEINVRQSSAETKGSFSRFI